jgi:dolichol kinase
MFLVDRRTVENGQGAPLAPAGPGRAVTADPDRAELDELVQRTRGLQPWRRLFHAANGVATAVALTWLPLERWQAIVILGGILAILVVADVVRLRSLAANRLFFRAFALLASPREARGIASSTWYTLGIFLAVALFPLQYAVSGILVLALGDPAASYIGQRWGERPFMGGTLIGTAAFFGVACTVLGLRHTLPGALVAAAVATIAERRSWPLDDNLMIPLACAGVLAAAGLVA